MTKGLKKTKLSAHIERVHSEEKANRYFCEVCEKPFSTSSHLSRHRRTKLDGTWATNFDFVETLREILEFSCDQCAKKFKRKDILKRHI